MHTQIIELVKKLYARYFAQRSLIPAGRLHEIAYEDLERDPVGRVKQIYGSLDLPRFQDAEPRLRTYVDSLATYKKNVFRELPEVLRKRVHQEWRPYFDEWGYAA
jgi:hypothetical protein